MQQPIKKPTYYLTTAIDYVNAKPHIGHAYEKIAADALARHYRQRGFDVYFLTGTDEHGTKIQKSAHQANKSPQEFTDDLANEFKKTWLSLDISFDNFIRTSEEQHYKVVQHIFKTLVQKGDIYKKSYKGLYCSGCETFLTIKDLDTKGNCPNHYTPPLEIEEENYFFKLTKYKEQIKKLVINNKDFLLPDYRVTEILNQLESIEDISVSRSSETVSWGVPVPDDPSQTVYVWIDALSNYITGIGYLSHQELFKKYWPAHLHLIGKDITKFHVIFWPAMLMALDLPVPQTIFAHGFITVNDTKMSKSVGNVISPHDIMEQYNLQNADAVRYYLLTCNAFGKDGNYSDNDFKTRINADLANNLGNLLNRTLTMLIKYNNGIIIKPHHFNDQFLSMTAEAVLKVEKAFDTFQISLAAEIILSLIDTANKYINENEPWKLAKDSLEEACNILYHVLETLRIAAILLYPFTPNLSKEILRQLTIENFDYRDCWPLLEWGMLPEFKQITQDSVQPILLRLDSEIAGKDKKSTV